MGAYLSAPLTDKESTDEANKYLSCGASQMQGWRMSQEVSTKQWQGKQKIEEKKKQEHAFDFSIGKTKRSRQMSAVFVHVRKHVVVWNMCILQCVYTTSLQLVSFTSSNFKTWI